MINDRTRSKEITSELDSFLAGIDEFSKHQKEEEKVPEKKMVVGAKTKDGKPAYYNRGAHNKQGSDQQLVYDAFINNLLGKKTLMEVQAEFYMKPIPPEAGTLRCILERDSTGWYKFFPKYTLILEKTS